MTTINRKLNAVLTLDREDGRIYAHTTPISPDLFKRYFRVISKTYSEIFSEGVMYSAGSGPLIAAFMMEDVAKELGVWEDVQKGLLPEIQRLTNIIYLTDQGWQSIPYHNALASKAVSEEEAMAIDNAVMFFTVASWMLRPRNLETFLQIVTGAHPLLVESLNCTEYARSLPMLTKVASSGEKPRVTASVPH